MKLRDGIGIALVGGFLGSLGVLFFKAIPTSNEQLIVYMLGQLSGFAGGIVAYHYTMTAGSQELEQKKTENTAKAFEAITATAKASGQDTVKPDIALEPGETATISAEGKKDE